MLLAVGAAALQVMVAPFLPATALILLVLTIPAAIVAAAGATTPSRRMFEYPLALAILGGVLIFIIGIVAAATDAESWVAAWTQFDIVLMWIGVWALRSRDIAHKESAWNRLFVKDAHRVETDYVERTHGMGERWEEKQQAAREAADPFSSPTDPSPPETGP